MKSFVRYSNSIPPQMIDISEIHKTVKSNFDLSLGHLFQTKIYTKLWNKDQVALGSLGHKILNNISIMKFPSIIIVIVVGGMLVWSLIDGGTRVITFAMTQSSN